MINQEFVLIAKTAKSFGLKGVLSAYILDQRVRNMISPANIFFGDDLQVSEHFVERLEIHSKHIKVKLKGIDDLDASRFLFGQSVYCNEHYLLGIKKFGHNFKDIKGLKAFTTQTMHEIGVVEDLVYVNGQYLISVKEGEQDILIPWHEQTIAKVAAEGVFLDIVEGLLELNVKKT